MELALNLERGPTGPWMAHAVGLPGLCWIRTTRERCVEDAEEELSRYLRSMPQGCYGVDRPLGGDNEPIILEEVVNRAGAVDRSGSPMACFLSDRAPHPFDAYRTVIMCCADEISECCAGIAPELWDLQPETDLRSVNQLLSHLGNCLWWYCSRIDPDLDEWDDSGIDPHERFRRFVRSAVLFYQDYPDGFRELVFTPSRYPSADGGEVWNYGKSERRQAEHLWEHLCYLRDNYGSYLTR